MNQSSCDVECYRNYFLIKFKDYATGKYTEFVRDEKRQLDVMGVMMYFAHHEVHGFNWFNYDQPMITLALQGADNKTLKDASDNIIVNNMKPWQFYQVYALQEPTFNAVDLMEVAPGVHIGLKMYACRMHAKTLQELPIDPAATLNEKQKLHIARYCANDLDVTHQLYDDIKERIDIRRAMSQEYGIDLRSKSDAQIAEAVIAKLLGGRPKRAKSSRGYTFHFDMPDWVNVQTDAMHEVIDAVNDAEFQVNMGYVPGAKEGVQLPKELEGRTVRIGSSTYKMGIGGLHSNESARSIICAPGYQLSDHDVKSYYPSLILNAGYAPPAVGPRFIDIYRNFYDTRLATKDSVLKATLKIVLNGTFGKLGSRYSYLFAPELLIQTTISGQLALLMLIERLELAGIPVMSANTDGIVVYAPVERIADRDAIIAQWEADTSLQTESTVYKGIFNRSVNDYVAVCSDDKIKRKGATFAKSGINENKHPDREICADAVVNFIAKGTPLRDTIKACKDIRKFVVVRKASKGARRRSTGEQLGKTLRWYYGHDKDDWLVVEPGYLQWDEGGRLMGDRVASSQGAVPCLELPDRFPDDVDIDYYVNQAREILRETGVWSGNA